MFPSSEGLSRNKDHSSSVPKSTEKGVANEGTPPTKSWIRKEKKAFKGKRIDPVDLTTCTSIMLRKYIEQYDEHPTQVPQCLL